MKINFGKIFSVFAVFAAGMVFALNLYVYLHPAIVDVVPDAAGVLWKVYASIGALAWFGIHLLLGEDE